MKKLLRDLILLPVRMNLFDGNTNVTSQTGAGQDLSGEMKTY